MVGETRMAVKYSKVKSAYAKHVKLLFLVLEDVNLGRSCCHCGGLLSSHLSLSCTIDQHY